MNRLKILRKEKKLTQDELAHEIGVSKITILRWENGERQIKPEKAKQLADFFGVSVGYLLGYTNDRKIYDDERIELDYKGQIRVYSEKRNKEKDLQTFVNCLKELDIVISDYQVTDVFNLIQSMNLNNEDNYWGAYMSYDLMMSHRIDEIYNDLAKNGYSLLVEDTSTD
ncbi:helix-turn-helix transcriptional regulator [Streptococcus sp. 27098_8_186]|uniref:helix-turn-helix domain-containing protein n=1 Tax=unclassified Streptococcus TaxID=2608887 RepID=UPI0030BABCC0